MKEYTYDGKKWYDLQPGQDVPTMATVVRQKLDAENGRNELEFMEWGRMTSTILTLVQSVATLQSVCAAHEEEIAELGGKLESVERSFELYQEVAGVEILVSTTSDEEYPKL